LHILQRYWTPLYCRHFKVPNWELLKLSVSEDAGPKQEERAYTRTDKDLLSKFWTWSPFHTGYFVMTRGLRKRKLLSAEVW
jgi:hypothetical protein